MQGRWLAALAIALLALCTRAVLAAEAEAGAGAARIRHRPVEEVDDFDYGQMGSFAADLDADEEGDDAEEEEEEAVASRHSRHHRNANSMIETAAATTTDSTAAASAQQAADADLIQSLFKLVKQGSEQDKRMSAELSAESAQSAALQTDLTVKQQQLVRHQTLMKNLQICLAHGPDALAQPQSAPIKPMLVEQTANAQTKTEVQTHDGGKNAANAEGTCDCMILKQKVADMRMELENSNNDEKIYKRQYSKAAKLLTETNKKLNRIRLAEKQPTQQTFCDKLTTCSACAARDGCAWCSSSRGYAGLEKGQGMCRRMDVTARLRDQPRMDGLTSGECEAKNWQTRVTSRISALSFNVFSSDLRNARRRAKTTFRLIKKLNPTFVAFQEVEKWFLQALKLEPWSQTYYHSEFGSGRAPGGLWILSKYPLAKVTYNEQTLPGQIQFDQRARVLTVQAVLSQTPPPPPPRVVSGNSNTVIVPKDGVVITVAATTLDWRSADSRADSLDFIFATLSPFNDVLLLGDLNFDSGALPETAHIPENWLDVWPALQPNRRGFTWDPDTNAYARASDPNSRSSRIDRMLVKSVHWLPRSIKLVGCSSLDLLCNGLYRPPAPPSRPHMLPQPLSQPHAATEANSPPLQALAKPPRKNAALGRGRSGNSVFLELASEQLQQIEAATTSWEQLDTDAHDQAGAEAEADTVDADGRGKVAVIPSNHYGLFAHFSKFDAKC
jgi:endonuclease/exonuclease/phosphatase family metal-dependent hydrolase